MQKKQLLLVMLLLTASITPTIYAQTKEIGIYGIWTDKAQYEPGETITVTLLLGWDFPESTDIIPGVYDTTTEEYIAEEAYTVSNSGADNITLSWTAPSTNGVYEYICNVFYMDEAWVQSETGYEEHYFYIQVGSTGSGEYNAWVTDVDAPSTVKPGELFTVTVDIDISFPTMTTFSVGITDPATGDLILDYEDQGQGDLSGTYTFDIYAPETEGDYTLGADVVFETPQGWSYTEDAQQTFNIKVSEGGGAIPGFPVLSLLLGGLVAVALLIRKPEL